MILELFTSIGLIFTPISAPNHHHKLDNFDRLAYCESDHEAHLIDKPFYGAFQFNLETWHSKKGIDRKGIPSDFSYSYQKAAAKELQHERGWEPWPECSRKLGL